MHVGALLRPGDTGLGDADAPTIGRWIRRFRIAAGGDVQVTMRIDAGGDFALLSTLCRTQGGGALHRQGAKLSADLSGAIQGTTKWRTVERDCLRATGDPEWPRSASSATRMEGTRVLVSRRRDADPRTRQRQANPALVRSRLHRPGFSSPTTGRAPPPGHRLRVRRPCGSRACDRRASKSGWGIGKIPSQDFPRQSRRPLAEAARAQSHAPLRPDGLRRNCRAGASLGYAARLSTFPGASCARVDDGHSAFLRSPASVSTDARASSATTRPPALGERGRCPPHEPTSAYAGWATASTSGLTTLRQREMTASPRGCEIQA